MVACGLATMWVGRAGANRSIDWSWGGWTRENTTPQTWDAAHRAAGPLMIWSGVFMVLGGIAGGACIPSNQAAGITVLLVLTALSLVTMFWSIGKGLKILGNRDLS